MHAKKSGQDVQGPADKTRTFTLRFGSKKVVLRGPIAQGLVEGIARAKANASGKITDLELFNLLNHQLGAVNREQARLARTVEILRRAKNIREEKLVKDFKLRLFAIGAEVISVMPKHVKRKSYPISHPRSTLQLVPTHAQRKEFVEKFMAAGMNMKSANTAVEKILWRFRWPALDEMTNHFEEVFKAIAKEMVEKHLDRFEYAGSGGQLATLRQAVVITKDEVTRRKPEPSLKETAKQRIRFAVLSDILLNSFYSRDLDQVPSLMQDSLEGFVTDFRNNNCRGV